MKILHKNNGIQHKTINGVNYLQFVKGSPGCGLTFGGIAKYIGVETEDLFFVAEQLGTMYTGKLIILNGVITVQYIKNNDVYLLLNSVYKYTSKKRIKRQTLNLINWLNNSKYILTTILMESK